MTRKFRNKFHILNISLSEQENTEGNTKCDHQSEPVRPSSSGFPPYPDSVHQANNKEEKTKNRRGNHQSVMCNLYSSLYCYWRVVEIEQITCTTELILVARTRHETRCIAVLDRNSARSDAITTVALLAIFDTIIKVSILTLPRRSRRGEKTLTQRISCACPNRTWHTSPPSSEYRWY